MKFFIASPWRNAEAVKNLADALAVRGHSAYSFLDNGANLATGTPVGDELAKDNVPIAEWGNDPRMKRIFEGEMEALRECHTLILLEPAGRSSLAEAGIAYGLGKRVILVGEVKHPEVVYLACSRFYATVEIFLNSLGSDTPKS
jgi:hypothetical protein